MKQIFTIYLMILTSLAMMADEHKETEKEQEGLVETTISKEFNYGLAFIPLAKGLAWDTQFYWTPSGAQLLTGGAYIFRVGKAKLIPGAYYVSENCEHGNKPWGCHDTAIGMGWEWQNNSWGTRGFVAQTLRKTELRFGLADPVQIFKRFGNGKWESGFAFVGEEEDRKYRGKPGLSARRYFGSSYAEVTILTGHKPEFRTTFGRVF